MSYGYPSSHSSLSGLVSGQPASLSGSQFIQPSNGTSSSHLRYNPIFKEVDQELRKLRTQFDGFKDHQQPPTDTPRTQQRTFINTSLIKPSTSNDLSESSTSFDRKINFTSPQRVNQSFNGFRLPKPSTAADKSVERKYFKPDTSSTLTKNAYSTSSVTSSRMESLSHLDAGNEVHGSSYGSRRDTETTLNSKPLLSSSDFLGQPSPPKLNHEQTALALRVRQLEIEQKEKDMKYKLQLEAEQKERDESIKRNEAKKYAQQNEKVILLTKKVDSLNRENTGLKNEVNKLTAEVKELAELRPRLEELHKTVLERELQIQQLVILNEQANEALKKREVALREMEVETGNVKQIVYADKTENAFNVAIRTSLEENQRIKERVNVKDEEIDHLRDLNKTLRNQFDALRNEIEIQKLKHMAEVKNIQTANDIDKTTVTNELSSLRKVVTVLDEKFKFLLKEERRKDEFMVGYFKGKIHDPNDKELLVNFFKQFEEVPKMTMSELMAQEHEIQNQLRDEIKRLQERIEVDDIIHKELRRQVEELQKRRY